MLNFVFGFCLGCGVISALLTSFPEGSNPYNKGMVDCRLKPERCDKLYNLHKAQIELYSHKREVEK
jgi:hypothetical protein